ncbi:hypothetical protein JL107_03850 [Nakamurella flavida]|uniref:Uncharacterized protein n=1 Tax=Nakamurella flavida TaxID=363630 RepID=A0A939BZC0_9ACTN|nr:hypothetical protein [Nakamurella flavida]MBM9475573.1 hypothetical protein [Nakamurella flavida]MDP9778151.1 hypothetical protein [Nakamurella flavida]
MQPVGQGAVDPWSSVPAPPPPRSRRVVGFVVLGAVVVLLVVLALWSNNSPSGAAEVAAGDCLAQEESGDYRVADCGSAAASLRVTASLAATAAAGDCDDVPADGALLTDDAVLCLDFLLTRGDCVQLTGPDLGRTDCPAPGQSANGILRVLHVLPDTQDTGSCPGTTEQILLHPASREVVCLGAA